MTFELQRVVQRAEPNDGMYVKDFKGNVYVQEAGGVLGTCKALPKDKYPRKHSLINCDLLVFINDLIPGLLFCYPCYWAKL